MNRKLLFGIVILLIAVFKLGLWSYLKQEYEKYGAVQAYANNDFQPPSDFFSSQLVDDPRNEELNYNAGVVQYRQQKYKEAKESFMRATKTDSSQLEEQSYFNIGNTQVQLNELEEAVKSYEKVLSLNPNNEMAKHNLALVQEMLKKKNEEEQKQQQEEQRNKEQQEQQENKDKDQSQQNEKPEEEKSKKEQGGSSDSNGDKDEQQENKQDSQKQQEENEKTKGDGKGQKGKESSEEKENGNKPEPERDKASEGEKNRSEKDERQQSSGQEGGEKEHGNPLLEQQQEAGRKMDEQLGEGLRALLQQAEKHDEGEYKKIIKTQVRKEMPSYEGQKNW